MDCNGNDDAPDDNLKERLTDLETPKYEQRNEAYMNGCLERFRHKRFVVRWLIRYVRVVSLRVLHFGPSMGCHAE
jgi:hypothetical protein